MHIFSALFLIGVTVTTFQGNLSLKEMERVREAATVVREIRDSPDKQISQDLWDKAQCVVVVPSLKKAAFVVGGEYGKGLMSCRHGGSWMPPVFMEIGKGSWGAQIGAESIDLVLLVMNARGMDKLLHDKVTVGAEASLAAGPVGRDARAATDAQLNAEILAYSRTQGLFAGINISGGVLRPDDADNHAMYGNGVSARNVLIDGGVKPTPVTDVFLRAVKGEPEPK